MKSQWSVIGSVCAAVLLGGCSGGVEEPTLDEEPDLAESMQAFRTSVLFDDFSAIGSSWLKADWGAFSDANRTRNFEANNVTASGTIASLALTNVDGTSADGAELRTNDYFQYGLYQVKMKPFSKEGTIQSFFTYTSSPSWDEIDIEFLGKDTNWVQFNYFKDGVGGHEEHHELGFNAADDYHIYAFEWAPSRITWYVDNTKVHEAWVDMPRHEQRVTMNVWARDDNDSWAGDFSTSGLPASTSYDWVKISPTQTTNPGFDSSLSGWSFWNQAGTTASASLDSQAAKIGITSGGAASWDIQLYQAGKSVTSGRQYRVSFDAKADCSRSFVAKVEDSQSPYTQYGSTGTVTLQTSWQHHDFTFTAGTTDSDARVNFLAGNSTCDVWLDSVVMVEL